MFKIYLCRFLEVMPTKLSDRLINYTDGRENLVAELLEEVDGEGFHGEEFFLGVEFLFFFLFGLGFWLRLVSVLPVVLHSSVILAIDLVEISMVDGLSAGEDKFVLAYLLDDA